ncbi:MAG TPA: HIT domain-containing protein [Pseudomonadota bacterium]|nr:HIT domain-containing protein [Xanthomonadales bacterium]MBP8177335.1 HIT domain-containing protein [Xanthomonadales bacterium]HQY37600.1 HIT domain-containing protein [Pseudomonadota bacterium]
MNAPAFALDPRLAADTLEVGDLQLSRVLLMNDARHPWLILVPRRAGLVEFLQLDRADCAALDAELRLCSLALMELHRPDKLNVAALGNVVRQFHVHVIARFTTDAAWPRPVWGGPPAPAYAAAEAVARVKDLRAALRLV